MVVTPGDFVRCDRKVVAREDPAEADLRIEMSPAGRIDFTMVDAEDKPVKEIYIQVRMKQPSRSGRYTHSSPTKTDEAGRFEHKGLPFG